MSKAAVTQKKPPNNASQINVTQPDTLKSEASKLSVQQVAAEQAAAKLKVEQEQDPLKAHFEMFILKPQNINKVWDSSQMKEDLIHVFQAHFKPKSSIEPEKVEYNEINIFAEFQLYNLMFCKNELLLGDQKCSMILDVFWRLLEFNPDQPVAQVEAEERSASKVTHTPSITSFHGQSTSGNQSFDKEEGAEAEFGRMLVRKFELFKKMLLELINESEKVLKFQIEEVKRITIYAHKTYFKHIRLYDYMLNNKQLSEVKRTTLQSNVPIIAPSLNDALLLSQEEQIPFEDEDEGLRKEIIAKRENVKERLRQEEEMRLRMQMEADKGEETDEELKEMDDRLKRSTLAKESKIIIHQKVLGMEKQINQVVEERQRQLDEKINVGAKKK